MSKFQKDIDMAPSKIWLKMLCATLLLLPPMVLLPRAALAVPIVQSVKLSPLTLPINCSVLSCPGFTQNQNFTLLVGVMNNAGDPAIQLLGLSFDLREYDPGSPNDPMGVFPEVFTPAITLAPGASTVVSETMAVSAATLNSACPGGCDSRTGAILETFNLEFVGEGTLSWDNVNSAQIKEQSFAVPEPATLGLIVLGLFVLETVRLEGFRRLST